MRKYNEITKGVIRVEAPQLEELTDRSRISSVIDIVGERNQVWFSVPKKYGSYLCEERSDAFLIGLLPVAMRRGLDIVCEAPVSERLLYQLRSTLLPLLAKYGRNVYEVKIDAPVAREVIVNAGAVGAGISCGVDSLHIVKNCSSDKYPGLKLTHLVLNNVGAFGETGSSGQYQWTIGLACRFCDEYGYELIVTNSNIFDVVGLDFEQNHTYMNTFAIYCLQKLWKVFYYGSWGLDIQQGLTFIDNEIKDCAAYDPISLDVFSTESLKIHSEGSAYDRYEKTAHLVDFEPAQQFLQVCVSGTGRNCGHCFKCKRTLLTLDALGALDRFGRVFDIDDYKRNRRHYLRYLYRAQLAGGDKMLRHIYDVMGKDIAVGTKILGLYDYWVYRSKSVLRPWFVKLGLLNRR